MVVLVTDDLAMLGVPKVQDGVDAHIRAGDGQPPDAAESQALTVKEASLSFTQHASAFVQSATSTGAQKCRLAVSVQQQSVPYWQRSRTSSSTLLCFLSLTAPHTAMTFR